MSKRCRRKQTNKKKTQCNAHTESQPQILLMCKEHCPLDSSFESMRILNQIKGYMRDIYLEHIKDLEQRKEKRLTSRNPTEYFQPYNLVVNRPFQQRIKLQIQTMIKLSFGETLKESLISSMNEFINSLQMFMQTFNGKKGLVKAIMFYEAYHTLYNSISQLGSITSELISKYAFEILSKKTFYHKIAVNYTDLLEKVDKNESSMYITEIKVIMQELESMAGSCEDEKYLKFECASTICSEECGETFHNLPIDEVVNWISYNEEEGKKVKVKGKKVYAEIDREVLEFTKILEAVEIPQVRKKPALSEKYLTELRVKLKTRIY